MTTITEMWKKIRNQMTIDYGSNNMIQIFSNESSESTFFRK